MKKKLNSILLIDDDEPTNYYTQMIIEESGFTDHIMVVQGGREALDYLSNGEAGKGQFRSPDLIFLDINMPAMDGWEFLDEYKKLEKGNHAQRIVVMLTTSFNPDDRVRANEIPEVSGFEIKPLTEEKLQRIINKYFPE